MTSFIYVSYTQFGGGGEDRHMIAIIYAIVQKNSLMKHFIALWCSRIVTAFHYLILKPVQLQHVWVKPTNYDTTTCVVCKHNGFCSSNGSFCIYLRRVANVNWFIMGTLGYNLILLSSLQSAVLKKVTGVLKINHNINLVVFFQFKKESK